MQFHRDCVNFVEAGGQPIVHAGPEGIFTERSGTCRLSLIGMGGCPAGCTRYRATRAR